MAWKDNPVRFSPDSEWFTKQFDRLDLSKRAVARHLGVDNSSLLYWLEGRRELKIGEAIELATLLGQPIKTILIRAGYERAKKL